MLHRKIMKNGRSFQVLLSYWKMYHVLQSTDDLSHTHLVDRFSDILVTEYKRNLSWLSTIQDISNTYHSTLFDNISKVMKIVLIKKEWLTPLNGIMTLKKIVGKAIFCGFFLCRVKTITSSTTVHSYLQELQRWKGPVITIWMNGNSLINNHTNHYSGFTCKVSNLISKVSNSDSIQRCSNICWEVIYH